MLSNLVRIGIAWLFILAVSCSGSQKQPSLSPVATPPPDAGMAAIRKPPPPKDTDNDRFLDHEDDCPTLKGVWRYGGCPQYDLDRDGLVGPKDFCPWVSGAIRNNGCPDKCPMKLTGGKPRFPYCVDPIWFAKGKTAIDPKNIPRVSEVKPILKWKGTLFLQGHADDPGSPAHNRRLSLQRAQAVKRLLIKLDIPAASLQVRAYGNRFPAPGWKELGRTLNRRVEFLFD